LRRKIKMAKGDGQQRAMDGRVDFEVGEDHHASTKAKIRKGKERGRCKSGT